MKLREREKMLLLIIAFVVGLALGFLGTVWFYPQNKNHMSVVENWLRETAQRGNQEAQKLYNHVKNDIKN